MLFFTIYMVIVTGNLGKIVLIRVNTCLHTTMYFFLSHLSFVDLCFSTIVTPMMLRIFLSGRLLIQLAWFSVIALVHVGICILAVMAFDWYMAICNLLLYSSRMSKRVHVTHHSALCIWSAHWLMGTM